MKTTIFSTLFLLTLASVAPSANAARYLVDFGRNDVATGGSQGAITPSPDTNGHYWNNFNKEDFNANTGSLDVPDTSSISALTNDANGASGIGIQLLDLTGGNEWEANGANNGGLLGPNSSLLGDFAIETATRDYFFTTQGSASFVLNGLNPLATYDLEFFATRNTGATRETQYFATDSMGTTASSVLRTSGSGAGSAAVPNGNDDDTVFISSLIPDGSNSIGVEMRTISGNFSYIGIMSVTETVVPEPASLTMLGLSVLLLGARRPTKR